ncbi:MAG TPA: WhiB family transcriptional regulator [Streptosporangiaceae bacterium]|jgi:WhiB family redox-sensing transcriptional regulator
MHARGSLHSGRLPCQHNPDLFFSEAPQDLQRAQALCAYCPLQSECLADALERREPWGVWGGELLLKGEIIAGKRARGRPRKSGVAA